MSKTKIGSAPLLGLALTAALTLQAPTLQASLLNISQKPLVLSDSVAPNLILTLDDSGSMRFAFVPDSTGLESYGHRNMRRAKAAAFNSMYYNPAITYRIPTKVDANGAQAATGYSTSFSEAYSNGFNTSAGSLDLRSAYKVSWDHDISSAQNYSYSNDTNYSNLGTIYRLAENPEVDFRAQVTLQQNTTAPTVTTEGGIQFSITRTNRSCTATASYPGVFSNLSVPCSRSGNTNTASLAETAVPAYYYTLKANCTATGNDDCYQLVFVGSGTEAQQQNFAIWYSFYRNRALATLSAANLSFNNLPNSVRLTWQTLNACTTLNSSKCGVNYFRTFSGQHRGNFFSWLSSVTFDSGTPLRTALSRAGEFLRTSDAWAHTPNPFTSSGSRGTTVNSPTYSCRPSYHIMMTDGMWNGSTSTTRKPDETATTLPDSKAYSGQRPFYDATTNTLADLAFHYWATDANPSLDNDLKPYPSKEKADQDYWNPRYNPATWQHLVNYTIGLGLSSSLTLNGLQWDATQGTFGGTGYENLKSGTLNWPAASADASNNVYDLWHTAVNSRGEFFSVDDPDSMVQAFTNIIDRIGNFKTSASNPAVTASQAQGVNSWEVYETEFSSDDWSGDLKKYNVATDGSRTEQWSAKSQLSAARRVRMASSATTGSRLQDFTWSNLSATQKAWFNINPDSTNASSDSRGEARVDYVRGARGSEGNAEGTFRQRSSVLGDIVNSAPVVVAGAQYLAYLADAIDGNVGDYAAFQTTAASRQPTIYVGANDGILHGFNTSTGAETFAFVPSAVLPNLYRLSGQNYQSGGHRFYVDGTPVVTDVYYDSAWHTVLIGSLRGGGRSLFALDITDPSAVKLLWEFTHNDLGYTFPTPVVARLHNGRWAVVTGNGYGNQSGSTADKAALFVLDVETGEQLTPNAAPIIVAGDTTKANGLSSLRLADNNSDGIADYAYGGDLQGNLWRFDLFTAASGSNGDPFRDITNAAIRISYNGNPLFKAVDSTTGAAQPITAPPSLVRHPTRLGYLVIFGTGKYFEDTDGNVDATRAQSVYAIWDRKTIAQDTGSTSPPSITRDDLLTQTIETQTSTSIGGVTSTIRQFSQNTPQWYKSTATDLSLDSSVNQWGWKLDLQVGTTRAGEMLINPMSARGQVLLLSTLTPNDDPCEDGVETWLYGINAYSGGRTTFNVFDMDNSNSVDSGDASNGMAVSGRKMESGSGFTLSGNRLFSNEQSLVIDYGPSFTGRQSWQFIPEDD